MEENYLQYYNLETYLLETVHHKFHKNHYLSAFDFFCIIIWKANRAKSKIATKVQGKGAVLEENVKRITEQVYNAESLKTKLKVLIEDHKFRLPTASAILSILYPEDFTVYDYRVCNTFPIHQGLEHRQRVQSLWPRYQAYMQDVKSYGPTNFSLRDKDRNLWAKSFVSNLKEHISNGF